MLVFNLFQGAVLGPSTRSDKWASSQGSGLRGWIGYNTALNRTLCWAAGLVVLFPIVLAAAHLFCRFVDEPLVRLARTIENRVVLSDVEAVPEREMRIRECVERIIWA